LDNSAKKAKNMEKGSYFTLTEEYMKDSLSKILKMARGMNYILMDHFIEEIFKVEWKKAKESFSGRMAKYTMDSGKQVKNVVAAFGKVLMDSHT